jgi:hypothetical protein
MGAMEEVSSRKTTIQMLQRIQTLILLLALPVSLLIWLESMVFARLSGDLRPLDPPDGSLLADGVLMGYEHVALWGAMKLAAIICLIAVFMFRNRPRQLQLTVVAAVLYLLAILLSGFFVFVDYQKLAAGERYLAIGPGLTLPLAGVLLCLLAIRYIRKDERLVRSMDRLR